MRSDGDPMKQRTYAQNLIRKGVRCAFCLFSGLFAKERQPRPSRRVNQVVIPSATICQRRGSRKLLARSDYA